MATVQRIVARTSNRLFVGLPLCNYSCSTAHYGSHFILGRDPEYRQLNIDFTVNLILSGRLLHLLPKPLRSWEYTNSSQNWRMCRFFVYLTPIPWKINKAIRLLRPMIEERLKTERECGTDWEGRPVCLPVNMLLSCWIWAPQEWPSFMVAGWSPSRA